MASVWRPNPKPQRKCTRNTKILIAVVIGVIIVGTTAGVLLHVLGTKSNKGSYGDTHITPNPNLFKSFWGITYTPLKVQYPECGTTLEDVIEDLKIVSQITDRIRLYGTDCQQGEFTLEAIKRLNLKSLKVVLTIWVDGTDGTFERQKNDFFNLLETYGIDNISGVSVGNEALFRQEATKAQLIAKIKLVRDELKEKNISLPVFTSDLGDNFDDELIQAVDIPFANVHPFFAGTPVEDSAEWTFDWYKNNVETPSLELDKVPIISEVGWPTKGEARNSSIASDENSEIFLEDFVCEANRRGLRYYYFETLDAPWKESFGIRETSWGIFTEDRIMKVKIPDCPPTVGDIEF